MNLTLRFGPVKTALNLILMSILLPFLGYSEETKDTTKKDDANKRDVIIEKLDETKLFTPFKGFKWQILSEINGAFQMPTNWHFFKEENAGQLAYFLTKESMETEGSYKTGLSVKVIKKAKENIGKDAVKYAREIVAEMMRNTDTIGTAVGQASTVFQFTCRSRIKAKDGSSTIIHKLTMGNSRTDTFYLLTYEFPESQWDEAEKIAWVTFNNFVLDDEI